MGRPWSRASVFPSVVARLWAARAEVRICARATVEELRRADVAVLAPRVEGVLAEALLQAGVRCCNTPAATATAADKGACERALAAAGIPRPRTVEISDWPDVLAAGLGADLVVKPLTRANGRDVLAGTPLPADPPFPGPYLAQERIGNDGLDRKLYVVGDEVRGVLRRWPWRTHEDKLGRAFAPDDRLCEVALETGRALGLELYGVDVLLGPDGPVVVDVNALPGYKGVPDAAELLAGYLLEIARREREARCAR